MKKQNNEKINDVIASFTIVIVLITILCLTIKQEKKFNIVDMREGLLIVQNVEIMEKVYRIVDDENNPVVGATIFIKDGNNEYKHITDNDGQYYPKNFSNEIIKIQITTKYGEFRTEFENHKRTGVKSIIPIIIEDHADA